MDPDPSIIAAQSNLLTPHDPIDDDDKLVEDEVVFASKSFLFEDDFYVMAMNPGGKKFDRVNRLQAKANTFEMELLLDIHSELYQVRQGDRINVAIATTLSLDGGQEDGNYVPIEGELTLADDYKYVMHGRVFKHEQYSASHVQISASFGGLLMRLTGELRHLLHLKLDRCIYLLLREGNQKLPMTN
mmetsp:Transcript_14225/g.20114  ORF Transcript_14225/g.20114 Transcript_14225/m.20114 type:complete len:187 (-) Transcript_14225:43-603(-)